MSVQHQTETWIFYGACDLYFSLHSEEEVFDYYSLFFAIMALEKHLKGYLIYSKADEFSGLSNKKAIDKAVDIAKSYGHDFPKMASEVEELFPDSLFTTVLDRTYGIYPGRDLIKVLKDSYMETRYPPKRHVAMSFPVDEPGIYYNPLSSSDFNYFIKGCCNTIVLGLAEVIDLGKMLRNVKKQYHHLEAFSRFQNIYAPGKW